MEFVSTSVRLTPTLRLDIYANSVRMDASCAFRQTSASAVCKDTSTPIQLENAAPSALRGIIFHLTMNVYPAFNIVSNANGITTKVWWHVFAATVDSTSRTKTYVLLNARVHTTSLQELSA